MEDIGSLVVVGEQGTPDLGQRPSFAVASLTGGVGKTMTMRVLDYLWSSAGTPLAAYSIDSAVEAKRSKLARLGLVEGVKELTIDATDRDVAAAVGFDARQKHWGGIGDLLAEGGCLLDFGANVVQRFTSWARSAKPRELLGDAPPLFVLVPFNGNPQTAVDALWTMREFLDVESMFMPLKVVAVYNNQYGTVANADAEEVVETRRFVEAKGIPVVTLPRGFLGIAEKYAFMDLATAKAREFAKRNNDTPMGAQTDLRSFTGWLDEAVVSFKAAGLGPKVPAPAETSDSSDLSAA